MTEEDTGSKEKSQGTEHGLSMASRATTGALAITFLLACGYYTFWPRRILTTAPDCSSTSDCTVNISAPVDGVVTGALLLMFALFALMTFTGLIWVPTLGGNSVAPYEPPRVEQKSRVPEDAESLSADTPPSGARRSHGESEESRLKASLARWNKLPPELQEAASEFAKKEWGATVMDLQENTLDISKEPGRGNRPYYATFLLQGETRVVKLTKGGQGKRGVTAREDE